MGERDSLDLEFMIDSEFKEDPEKLSLITNTVFQYIDGKYGLDNLSRHIEKVDENSVYRHSFSKFNKPSRARIFVKYLTNLDKLEILTTLSEQGIRPQKNSSGYEMWVAAHPDKKSFEIPKDLIRDSKNKGHDLI